MTVPFGLGSALARRYEFERELGRGGMATVYLARDLKHEREVAIKVLLPEIASALGPERFLREIRTAARLSHPHIVGLHDSGEASGFLYYVMPYIRGESLRKRLDRDGRLEIDEVLAIAKDVAAALDYAHNAGLLHRDIKPENILLHEGEAMVADFGIALAVTSAGGQRLTETGLSLGTPTYMSPEQIAGDRMLDGRSDQYALACVVYEMLTGEPPYQAATAAGIIVKHATAPVPSVRRLRAHTSPLLDEAITRALDKNPEHRFQSARTFTEALRATQPRPKPGVESPPTEKSVLVLPFANTSPDPGDEYLSDGLTEELISALSLVRELRVVSGASSFRLKGTAKDLPTISRELAVRYIVEGRVRKAGQEIRITARLVELPQDQPIWSDKYDGNLANVLKLQEEVARSIANALHVRLVRSASREPTSEVAEAYLRGRHFLRQSSTDGYEKAIASFQQAVEADPDFGPAFAGLAVGYVMSSIAWAALPSNEVMPKARAAAERARALDPVRPESHVALGLVATYYDWDLNRAELSFLEALGIAPNHVDAHMRYVDPLIWLDTRYPEALDHIRRAEELDPTDPFARCWHGVVHYFARDYDKALDQVGQAITLEPLSGFAHYCLGFFLATVGRTTEAIASLGRAIELDGRAIQYVAWLGAAYAIAGRRDEARHCLAEIRQRGRQGESVAAWTIPLLAGLGETEAILSTLEEAAEERSGSLIFHLTHATVDPVRRDPRFVNLLKRMKLDHLIGYRPAIEWRPSLNV